MALRINGEIVTIAESAAERASTGYYLEIDGSATVELRLAELDQADPAGRYRLQVSGDGLRVQRSAAAAWGSATTFAAWATSGQLTQTIADAQTTIVSYPLLIDHSSSGTPAVDYGTGLVWAGASATVATRTMGTIETAWSTATDATRTAYMMFRLVNSTTLGEIMRITGAGGNLLINTTTTPTGAVANIVLGNDAGTRAPVLGAAQTDLVSICGIDVAAWDARFAVQSEAGSPMYLGNDRLRWNAATGILAISTTTVVSLTTAGIALGTLNLTLTGTISATGARVTQSYHTSITSTNAVTVDSSQTVKRHIRPYGGDALATIRGIDVITFEYEAWLDRWGGRKLGIRSESVGELLALTPIERPDGSTYPGLNMYALEALLTRALQQVEERLVVVEAENIVLKARLARL